jgi:hypothetical protein
MFFVFYLFIFFNLYQKDKTHLQTTEPSICTRRGSGNGVVNIPGKCFSPKTAKLGTVDW